MLKKVLFITCAFLFTGCGQIIEKPIPVRSVYDVCGITPLMTIPGVVTTGSVIKIKKDANRKVAEVKVKKGDLVKKDDVLFVYDAEQARNSLDKAELEYENQKNTIISKQQELIQLELDKQKVSAEDQIEYDMKIAETDIDLREAEYNLDLKEKEIMRLQDSMSDLEVTSPFEGKVDSIAKTEENNSYGDIEYDDNDSGDSDGNEAFIKLVESDRYRIKGTIDDSTINMVSVGTNFVIHSRMTEDTWTGFVSDVNYKNSKNSNEDDESAAGKNQFYVELEDLDGLMLGQHVYMTPDEEQTIELPKEYISDPNDPYVWVSENNLLAKRPVTIHEEGEVYIVDEGLTPDDLIAVPSSANAVGMSVMEVFDNDTTTDNDVSTDLENEEADYATEENDFEDDDNFDEDEMLDDDENFVYDDEDEFVYDDEDLEG